MKNIFLVYISLLIVLMSCSGIESLYSVDFPMTNRTIASQIESYQINVPSGWRKVEANGDKFIDIWMVDDYDEYSITFTPINTDIDLSDTRDNQNKIKSLINVYIESLFNEKVITKTSEEFTLNSIQFSAKEYHTITSRERFVIFRLFDIYFVSRAVSTSGNPNYEKLFGIQNSILSSIKIIKK